MEGLGSTCSSHGRGWALDDAEFLVRKLKDSRGYGLKIIYKILVLGNLMILRTGGCGFNFEIGQNK
jgi:hypothetical protein